MVSPVLWRARQWDVTRSAIIALREGGYWIGKDRVAERWGANNDYLTWPVHLIEKGWVDVADFEAAYRFAVKAWKVDVPTDLIDRFFRKAWRASRCGG